MIKFYMAPGSCSTGIHILLEELDLIFEVYLVNLMAGDQFKQEYLATNPRASIPCLVKDDGNAITDFQAIAWWLGRSYPKAGLLSDDLDQQTRILDVMAYVIAMVHMQGFARIFTTDKFTPNETDFDWVRQQGREIVERGFAVIDKQLSDSGYVADNYSIADAALFYVEFWAVKTQIELPPACGRHYSLMLGRPAVQRVLIEEGYGADVP